MSDPGLIDALAALPHFRDLPGALLQRVAGLCKLVELRAGEVIFSERQRCDAFFVVREGRVKVFRLAPDGREQVVHHVGAGETFAEAALFHHGVFPASAAAAVSPTRLIRLDGARFLALLSDEPDLAKSMIGSLCGWLHTMLDRIEVLTLQSAGARLATWLLRLPAREGDGALTVELPMAKKDVAAELSITPETLSRLLARWKERGVVAVNGGSVELLDTRMLEALAESVEAGKG
jgi:CRP/FNR family transcriptional regulator